MLDVLFNKFSEMFFIVFLFLFLLTLARGNERVTEKECLVIRKNGTKMGIFYQNVEDDSIYVTPNLYVGNVCAAHNDGWLDRIGINLIVSISEKWLVLPYEGKRFIGYFHYRHDDIGNELDGRAQAVIDKMGRFVLEKIERDQSGRTRVLLFDHDYISPMSPIVFWFRDRLTS